MEGKDQDSTLTKSFTSEELSTRQSIRAIINVGGSKHEVLWRNLDRFPFTRLGQLKLCTNPIELCDDYSEDKNEFFFDRQPKSFNSVLDFYRTGKLHFVDEMCPIAFSEDLEYWGIDESCLDTCCLLKYHQKKYSIYEEISEKGKELQPGNGDDFGDEDGRCHDFRKSLWDLFENPKSSFAAKVSL